MEEKAFELGRVVATASVARKMKEDKHFRTFVYTSLGRYMRKDWGNTCNEDKKLNDTAVKKGSRILAVYKKSPDEFIWIITEWDRSTTTILFPSEY